MNAANFVHTGYLLRIKAAILAAVAAAPDKPEGRAITVVTNRHNQPSLCVIARVGQGFEVFGGYGLDDDVTPLVVAALRRHHAAQPPRLAQVDAHQGRLSKGLIIAAAICLPFWAGVAFLAFN